jgi:hypothetical protein
MLEISGMLFGRRPEGFFVVLPKFERPNQSSILYAALRAVPILRSQFAERGT